jgi:hypothetical protein
MQAFAAMIDTRQLANQERLPRADALLAGNAPERLLAARAAVDARLTAIETANDVAALGNAGEQDQWHKVRQLESALAAANGSGGSDDGEDLGTERDKIRLMKGVLYWRLDSEFKQRMYAERRAMRALDAALNEAQNRWVRVQHARENAPGDTGGFAQRIAALAARIAALRESLAGATTGQQQFLEQVAGGALLEQKERIAAYEVQARFALADIYDRSVNGQAPAQPAAPPAEAAQEPDAAPADAAAPATDAAPAQDPGTANAPAGGTP